MTVKFKYGLDDHVITTFNEEGMISMLGYDEGGPTYHILTKHGGAWYKEKLLSLCETPLKDN